MTVRNREIVDSTIELKDSDQQLTLGDVKPPVKQINHTIRLVIIEEMDESTALDKIKSVRLEFRRRIIIFDQVNLSGTIPDNQNF